MELAFLLLEDDPAVARLIKEAGAQRFQDAQTLKEWGRNRRRLPVVVGGVIKGLRSLEDKSGGWEGTLLAQVAVLLCRHGYLGERWRPGSPVPVHKKMNIQWVPHPEKGWRVLGQGDSGGPPVRTESPDGRRGGFQDRGWGHPSPSSYWKFRWDPPEWMAELAAS